MSKETTGVGSGSGGLTLLFLVFLVLKLTGVIGWSWWLITAPLWIPAILSMIIILYIAVIK